MTKVEENESKKGGNPVIISDYLILNKYFQTFTYA